jgi:hypothetical protein
MKREVRLLLLLTLAVIVTFACRHKPAYSEMDANKTARSENRNSKIQPGATPSTAVESPAPSPAQPAPSPPQVGSFKTPRFLDQTRGEIKDLPSYPRAQRINIQMGPNQGVNTLVLVLQTADSMDMVAAFYEGAIKNNHWTVINKTIDPEQSEWILKKGEENGAKVQVKKDPQTRRMNIIIFRGEKLEEPSK